MIEIYIAIALGAGGALSSIILGLFQLYVAGRIERVYKATNGLKDELVAATYAKAFAEGVSAEKARAAKAPDHPHGKHK